jgi:hypothetical protein
MTSTVDLLALSRQVDLSKPRLLFVVFGYLCAVLLSVAAIAALGHATIVIEYAMVLLAATLSAAHFHTFDSAFGYLSGVVIGTPLLAGTCVLLCAPFSLHTVFFSLFLSTLTTGPLSACTSGSLKDIRRLLTVGGPLSRKEALALYPAIAASVAAWISAWFLPLDWHTQWQVWPTPCVAGAVSGYVVGLLFTVAKGLFSSIKPRSDSM